MDILKLRIITLTTIFILSPKVLATEQDLNWFFGSAISFNSFNNDGEKSSGLGLDLRSGYQFGNYLKLMVGAGTTGIGDSAEAGEDQSISSLYALVRPQWEFDNGFLVYVDAGVMTTSSGDGAKVGYGIGYNEGQHEVTLGFELNVYERNLDSTGVALQYIYHF